MQFVRFQIKYSHWRRPMTSRLAHLSSGAGDRTTGLPAASPRSLAWTMVVRLTGLITGRSPAVLTTPNPGPAVAALRCQRRPVDCRGRQRCRAAGTAAAGRGREERGPHGAGRRAVNRWPAPRPLGRRRSPRRPGHGCATERPGGEVAVSGQGNPDRSDLLGPVSLRPGVGAAAYGHP